MIPGETVIVFVLVFTRTTTFTRRLLFLRSSVTARADSLIEAYALMPFLTEKFFLPNFSSGFAARWSSTVPAQTIGEIFWQFTCIFAIPFAPISTVRGPRIIRGTSWVTGVFGPFG